MLAQLIGFIPGLFKSGLDTYKEGKQIKAAKDERKDELKKMSLETKLESIKKAETANLDIDTVNGSDPIPWANDVSFALGLLPIPLAFIPGMAPHIAAGFTVIGNMPDAYKYGLGMMLVSVWGYRNLVEPIIKSIIKAWLGNKR